MTNFRLWRFATLAFALLLGLGTSIAGFAADDHVGTAAKEVKHVFLIVLENKSFSDTFGTSTQDPYLQGTLVKEGALLTQYYGTGHVSLDNYLSMVSGQAPTPDTDNDCIPGLTGAGSGGGNYNDVKTTGTTAEGQVVASGGCIYAKSVRTIADQLKDNGLTWKAYMGDMGNDPTRESATCGHPTIGVGTDNTNEAEAPSSAVPLGDAYATRHDPFMYFHSIIDAPACKKRVVNLDVHLATDLKSIATTANFTFITPNLCDDGHDGSGTGAAGTLCANGGPGGLASIDAFLKKWIPLIEASPAYKKNGLIIITFDESGAEENISYNPTSGLTTVDIVFPGNFCCNQQPGPNVAANRPSTENLLNSASLVENLTFASYGGDQVGAVLLSPFIKPGTISSTPYNHYSLLRSVENIFNLGHLGYAGDRYELWAIGDDTAVFKPKS